MSAGHSSEARKSPGCPLAAIGLLCVAFGLALITAWVPTLEHTRDPLWTTHQKFHAFREVFLASVFSIAGLALCLGPLRTGRPHALSAVALLGVGVVAGFWVGLPITGIGKSEIAPYVNHGLQVIALAAGYAIARSSQVHRSRPPS